MQSYRFARRSFLSAIGGAVGFEILLNNMEAAAQGAAPPPRFLMMNWPVGTVRQQFIPTGSGTSFTTSKTGQGPGFILSPFDTTELRPYMIAMHGFSMERNVGFSWEGGCHEDGTPLSTTGASSPGTRQNGGEADDGVAGGPSWDQILLKHAAGLSRKDASGTIIGRGYYNAICDSRIDSFETSTRCLSYGYRKVTITSARPGGSLQENEPLRPTMAPITTFNDLFSGFMPGGMMTDMTALRILKHRRSVLDYSLKEINRLSALAPANERVKIDSHASAIRMIEAQLSEQIRIGEMGGGGGMCMAAMMPSASLNGKMGETLGPADYNNPAATTDDSVTHEEVGNAHAGILRAAFACDLIRVATFQWSPGTNHVSFKGMDPNTPSSIWMHHPLSHRGNKPKSFFDGARPGTDAYIWDTMVNINKWYFEKTAAIVNTFRTTPDPLATDGGNLLDRTVIPMVTEVADASHNRTGHAALIFGGTKLGMQGGRYQSVSGNHNQLWVTVAQAFLGASAVSTLASEVYVKQGADPIAGLWVAPT